MCVKHNTVICVARASNSKRDCEHDLYCCLLPRSKALHICRSGCPIATGSTLEIQHCLVICILTMRDGQTRKQFQGMECSTCFQSLFTKLVIASDCFTTLKTKAVLCDQFISLDLVLKTRTMYFLNLT